MSLLVVDPASVVEVKRGNEHNNPLAVPLLLLARLSGLLRPDVSLLGAGEFGGLLFLTDVVAPGLWVLDQQYLGLDLLAWRFTDNQLLHVVKELALGEVAVVFAKSGSGGRLVNLRAKAEP